MRTLTSNELLAVGGAGISLPFVLNEALEFGAMGVLFNIVLHGATLSTVGNGLLMGAGVGACYAFVRQVVYS